MMKYLIMTAAVVSLLFAAGCNTPARKVKKLDLGMTPPEVKELIGDPYTIRAAKVYEDGHTTQIWEYQPMIFTINPKIFWVYFENDKVVQWGEPGDFAGKGGKNVPVEEYKAFKSAR